MPSFWMWLRMATPVSSIILRVTLSTMNLGAIMPTSISSSAITTVPLPSAASAKQQAMLFQGLAMCDTCGTYQPFDKVRLRSKTAESFRCHVCHSKQCTLRRAFGKWPTEEFNALTVAEQQSFWNSITSLSGRQMIAKVQDTLQTYEESAEVFYMGGEYLPLGVPI